MRTRSPTPRRRLAAALALWAASLAGTAAADEACEAPVEVDRFRLLRQLSLDLRGRVPSEAELRALAADIEAGAVDESLSARVDEMIAGEEFSALIRRHHLDLLWPNIDGLQLVDPAFALLLPARLYQYDGVGDPDRLFILYVGLTQRGGLVPCKDEPAEWDEEGNLVFEAYPDGTRREGWVKVEPYWAPGTEVKVCALEAQMRPIADNGAPCDTAQGMFTGSCGCGPDLERCLSIDAALVLIPQFREQILRAIERVVIERRPYTDIFFDDEEDLNGPLVHYYRHLAPMAVDPIVQVPPVPVDALPDRPFTDLTWSRHPRGPEEHAGILTSMSYLLRFQTARARANRFYTAFLCAPFEAPPGGLPSPDDPCSDEPDLRERCGCNACHARLEPAAAHWGRFAEAGTMYLDPEQFPPFVARCAECARSPGADCDFICRRFYVTEIGHPDEAPFAGVLKSYQWRDEAELANLEAGPEKLVRAAIEDGRLAQCVVRKLFERLYHREMTDEERARDLPALAREFHDGGYDWAALVKRLVTMPGYRRMIR